MNASIVVRAWKDPEFRASLSPEERSKLPENPSGRSITELDESDLEDVSGGWCGVTLPVYCRNTLLPGCNPSFRICPTTTVQTTIVKTVAL